MKSLFCVVFAVFFFSPAVGASAAGRDSFDLQIDYIWTQANQCSTVSPEIRVSGVPAATKELRASLVDLDVPTYNHGGGTITYEGKNVIPTGALKNYRGPCPPSGQHRYTIQVDALDASRAVIGSGKKTVSCCP